MSEYLFVYGTLNPHLAPNDVRDVVMQLRPLGEGTMPGILYDLGDYPGAVFDKSTPHRVRGRIFELPSGEALLKKLDAYEEFNPQDAANSLFVRERHAIKLDNESELSCWVYLYNRATENAASITSGNYSTWAAQMNSGSPHGSFGR